MLISPSLTPRTIVLVDLILRGNRQNHLFGTGFDMVFVPALRPFRFGENAGGFNDHIHPEIAPWKRGRFAHCEDLNLFTVDDNRVLFYLDLTAIDAKVESYFNR